MTTYNTEQENTMITNGITRGVRADRERLREAQASFLRAVLPLGSTVYTSRKVLGQNGFCHIHVYFSVAADVGECTHAVAAVIGARHVRHRNAIAVDGGTSPEDAVVQELSRQLYGVGTALRRRCVETLV